MNRQEASSAIEGLLDTQARLYTEEDGVPLDGFVMTHWIGLSAWSGVDSDGDESSRIVVHLRDFTMPTWQIVGLLRAALLKHEGVYLEMGMD